MITIRISEIRFGRYLVVRKAKIPANLLSKIETYIYFKGGVMIEKNHYRVTSPKLIPMVNELERTLKIKFVEERGRRVD